MSPAEVVALIGGIITILGVAVAAIMWYIRVVVRDEVLKATKPIQPGYRNGGESLADVAHTVRRIADRLDLIEEELDNIEEEINDH